MTFEVQTLTACDGWANCWHDDGELLIFDTREDAQAALDEFLDDLDEAIALGNIEPGYTADHYRVAPVHDEAEPEPETG